MYVNWRYLAVATVFFLLGFVVSVVVSLDQEHGINFIYFALGLSVAVIGIIVAVLIYHRQADENIKEIRSDIVGIKTNLSSLTSQTENVWGKIVDALIAGQLASIVRATGKFDRLANTLDTSEQVVSSNVLESIKGQSIEAVERLAVLGSAIQKCQNPEEKHALVSLLTGRASGLTENQIADNLANERKISPKAAKTLLTKVSQYIIDE